jgi:hypothetical protein
MSTCREGLARRSGAVSSTGGTRLDSVRASAISAAWTAALVASELQDCCLGGRTGDCDKPEDPRCCAVSGEGNDPPVILSGAKEP